MVAGGLLYWPFEDPRFSADRAEFSVTNGTAWAWRVLPESNAYHLHAMAAHNGKLYAATSAGQAGLRVSADTGANWQVLYDHPTPHGLVSKITSFATFQGRLYVGVTQWRSPGQRILSVTNEGATATPGWPKTLAAKSLTAYRDSLFAILQDKAGHRLWHSDGGPASPVAKGPSGQPLRALAASEEFLWGITAGNGKGALWQSEDGLQWTKSQDFPDAPPVALAVYDNTVYLGTIGPGRRGTLWGPRSKAPVHSTQLGSQSRSLPPAARRSGTIERRLTDLNDLSAPATLSDRDWLYKRLMPPIWALARSNNPNLGAALTARLQAPFPDRSLTFYRGQVKVSASALARWYLLWAMSQHGSGRVPPDLLAIPWDAAANQPEKYFHPAPAAAWAMAQLGQGDTKSLNALMARLNRPGDPAWLSGDIVGALTVLTGQRFGHDYDAWRSWWAQRQSE